MIRFSVRHLGGVPARTSVDPAAFSEDEYPVRCLVCGYTLRGLPDGRCPECGGEFQRGLLLVEEYVRLRRPRVDWAHRWLRVLAVMTFVLWAAFFMFTLLVPLAVKLAPDWTANTLLEPSTSRTVGVILVLLLSLNVIVPLANVAIQLAVAPPFRKSRAVRAAARERALASQSAADSR